MTIIDISTLTSSSVTNSTDTFYGILCSGLTGKTKQSFIASNSSFSECVRKHHISFSSNTDIFDCTTTTGNNCVNTTRNTLQVGRPHIVHSCIFQSISSSVSNGGVLYLHDTSRSTTTSLTVDCCIFNTCSNTQIEGERYGGGAIYIDCGTLSITSSLFHKCQSVQYGGGIYAYNNCDSATVRACNFINCAANHAGGIMTHMGPTSSISSSHFISCSAEWVGGGFYHNCKTTAGTLTLSDSLFTNNRADYEYDFQSTDRGGGAFEDCRESNYTSKFSFSFFSGNRVTHGVGNDISFHYYKLDIKCFFYLFTTTKEYSVWNVDDYVTDWLPFGTLLYRNTWAGTNNPYPETDPNKHQLLEEI